MATVKFREPTKEEKDKICNAIYINNIDTLQGLYSSGVDVTGIIGMNNWTALHIAAQCGHSEVIGYLLTHGAAVNAVDDDNWTALHMAAMFGHNEVIGYLVQHGAAVDAVDLINMTPLEWAVDKGHSDTVYYFINNVKMDITKFNEETQVRINELMKVAKKKQNNADKQAGSHGLLQRRLNQGMIDFMIKARKQNKTVKVRYGRVLFSGSSGAGKTSFFKLLMNRKCSAQHISTGLVNSEQVIAAVKVDIHTKDQCVEFNELDVKTEILKLKGILNKMASKLPNSDSELPKSKETRGKKYKLSDVEVILATESKSKIEDTCETKTEKVDEINLFTFMDTGGQPQFISMIPAVNSSALVTFIVHNLNNNLNDEVTVSHGNKYGKQTFLPYTIGCTNLELIKSLISFADNIFLRKKPFLEDMCERKSKQNISYLSFIGSHLDEALANTNNEDDIHKIDRNLDTVLKDTGQDHVWMNVHPKYKYLIPVNNLTSENDNQYGTHDSAKKIRRKLYEKILEQEVYNVPIVWLLLELEIRNKCENQKFITYHEVVKLCRQHNLMKKEDDIKNGLRFHHLFGILLYFDEVPGLCDYIFTDYQWLFNNITEIVYQSYLCYGQDNIRVVTDFKWKGFFTESLLDKCDLKLKHYDEHLGEIEVDFKSGFINLLQYLRIIAPLSQADHSIIFFMPSILSTCDLKNDPCTFPHEVLPEDTVICDKAEPLLIQFGLCNECVDRPGSFPRGTFCCLIVELLQDNSTWRLYWSDGKESVFDNLVTFLYRPAGQHVILIDRIFYLQVVMLQEKGSSLKSIHYKIKLILEVALENIGEKLNFNNFKLTFSFMCHKCLVEGKHVMLKKASCSVMDCCHGHSTQITNKHTIWDKASTLMDSTEYYSEPQQGSTLTETDGHLPKKRLKNNDLNVYVKFYPQLVTSLPMKDDIFVAHLIELLPGDLKHKVGSESKLTPAEATKCFLDNAIGPAIEIGDNEPFTILLTKMEASDSIPLGNIAKEIRKEIQKLKPGTEPCTKEESKERNLGSPISWSHQHYYKSRSNGRDELTKIHKKESRRYNDEISLSGPLNRSREKYVTGSRRRSRSREKISSKHYGSHSSDRGSRSGSKERRSRGHYSSHNADRKSRSRSRERRSRDHYNSHSADRRSRSGSRERRSKGHRSANRRSGSGSRERRSRGHRSANRRSRSGSRERRSRGHYRECRQKI